MLLPFFLALLLQTQPQQQTRTAPAPKPDAKPATVRVAAIGSGHIFVGPELSPAKEELMVNTCNWLLGRDNLLRRSDLVWSFPRVALSAREHTLWNWGAWFGLPALFGYLGLVVLMVRRLR